MITKILHITNIICEILDSKSQLMSISLVLVMTITDIPKYIRWGTYKAWCWMRLATTVNHFLGTRFAWLLAVALPGHRRGAAAFAYNTGWSMVNTRHYNNTGTFPLAICED